MKLLILLLFRFDCSNLVSKYIFCCCELIKEKQLQDKMKTLEKKAKEDAAKIRRLDDEISNKMPLDIIEEAKKNFDQYFQ